MASCTHESWTLKEIKESLEKETHGKKRIVVPMFQRGKRWDQNKKSIFIDSLRKRYPIGTLLFYKTVEQKGSDTIEVYTLIDGLQRGTTIKDYLSRPLNFFSIDDINKMSLQSLYKLLSAESSKDEQARINEIIISYMTSVKNCDDLDMLELFTKICEVYPNISSGDFSKIFKEDFKNIKEDYNKLSSTTIPVIVYTGEENTLPEIFERINSKGVALTEYEIYAASWPREEFTITNDGIINYVLKKYDTLNDGDYAIKDYDREAKRINKNVNSFEYVFGLSKYLQNKYGSLNFFRNLGDDETNPIAFQLLNAMFNSSHGSIKDVHKIILKYKDNIDTLENALSQSIDFVDSCIEPVLKFKGNNRNKEGKIFHSQFQILSLISFVFRRKYDIKSNSLTERKEWNQDKKTLKKYIWKYYIFDILTKYWGEGGTGKIHSANAEGRYLIDLSEGQFATAFDSYVESMYGRKESKQVSNPSPVDYVLLNTIYLNSFSAMQQLSVDKFDVEHIATKDQMKQLIKQTNSEGLPISHFANLCYLPEYENRAKGANNFYQDSNYLANSGTTLSDIEKKYSFTKKENLEFMDVKYKSNEADILKEYYLEFLKNRTIIVKEKFLKALGY